MTRRSKKLSVIAAIGHFLCFATYAGLLSVAASGEGAASAQWQMGWVIWGVLDFPVSLLGLLFDWPNWEIEALPYPFGDFKSFLLPCILFGLIGTVWYGFLGAAVGYVIDNLTTKAGASAD